jgi:AraC-like DNA-binding protein
MREADRNRADPRAVESVLRAVDFVEERMGDPVGVEDMARAACYSPFYFSRLFASATGHSPYGYLMRRRIAAAAEKVVGGNLSLTTIALDFGFEAPDSFSRAFRRCFGTLPSEARKAGTFPRRVARTRIERDYVETRLGSPPGPPTRLESGDMYLASPEPGHVPGAGLIDIIRRGEDLRATSSFLGIATGPGTPPFPRQATLVPGGTFARFHAPGGAAGLRTAVEFAYRAWLPEAAMAVVPAYDLVEYGEAGPEALLLPVDFRQPHPDAQAVRKNLTST